MITLPTSPDVRQRLTENGWRLVDDDAYPHRNGERLAEEWVFDVERGTYIQLRSWTHPVCHGDMRPILEFAAIVGITPSLLTEEERKALTWAEQYTGNAALCEGTATGCAKYKKRNEALRDLLKRMGG